MQIAVNCCYLSDLENLLFLLLLMCASYGMSSTCVLMYAMPSLQRCMPCIFVISVVTSTSMQTRLRDVTNFRYFVPMYPCGYREIHAHFGDVQ